MHSHKLKKTKRSYSDVANDADESTGILLENYLLQFWLAKTIIERKPKRPNPERKRPKPEMCVISGYW